MTEHDQREDYDDEPVPPGIAPEPLRAFSNVLWALGLVQLVAAGIGLMFVVCSFISARVDGEYAKYKPQDLYWMLAMSGVGAAFNVVVMWGAAGMGRCYGYRRSAAAAVLSAFPLPCFYLGVATVPIGLLALYQLRKRRVRSLFLPDPHAHRPRQERHRRYNE